MPLMAIMMAIIIAKIPVPEHLKRVQTGLLNYISVCKDYVHVGKKKYMKPFLNS
jgi:hypothetical protein